MKRSELDLRAKLFLSHVLQLQMSSSFILMLASSTGRHYTASANVSIISVLSSFGKKFPLPSDFSRQNEGKVGGSSISQTCRDPRQDPSGVEIILRGPRTSSLPARHNRIFHRTVPLQRNSFYHVPKDCWYFKCCIQTRTHNDEGRGGILSTSGGRSSSRKF